MFGETTIGDGMDGMDSLGPGLGEMEFIFSAMLARWGRFCFEALLWELPYCTRFLLQIFSLSSCILLSRKSHG